MLKHVRRIERPCKAKVTRTVSISHCGSVADFDLKIVQSPLGGGPGVSAELSDLRGGIRQERDGECIERRGETVARGFDVRFLASPAAEERRRLLVLGKREQVGLFFGRKK